MTLGWSAPGVTGPITADAAENLVWATGSGFLWGLDATTGAVAKKYSLSLDSAQHFPTPKVVSNWVVIEKSGQEVAGFPTPANPSGVAWTSAVLDGEVQSAPVIVGNTVVVATEHDSLYGLDLATGNHLWGPTSIGTAEPLADIQNLGGVAGCGNIDPLGVTSNLGYDPITSKVYAVGERETGTNTPHLPEFVLVAADPATGVLSFQSTSITTPLGTDIPRQQQRAGLLATNGKVYVGFGGLAGDCGTYHGYVVAASETNGSVVGSFQVAPAPSRAGAVWGTSGPVADSAGNVYATTGNSFGAPSPPATDWSDAVVKLNASAGLLDYFQPPQWRADNNSDLDLGSTGPVLTPSQTQVFVIGKQHDAFLLNVSSLGGADHNTPVGTINACPSGMAFGQNAMIGSSGYVACSSGLRQVHLS
jgi:hypothetical protein